MLTVCIDYSSALAHAAGVSRYVRELVDALVAAPDSVAITLVHNTPKTTHPEKASLSVPIVGLPYGIKSWRAAMLAGGHVFGRSLSRKARFSVFHGPDCIVPAVNEPTVVTVHDLTVLSHPQFHSRLNRAYMRLALPTMVRRARYILADSQSTRAEVISRLNVAPDKVVVIYPGINHSRFYPVPITKATRTVSDYLNSSKPFLLALGTLEPRKNLVTLLQAFAKVAPENDCQLVLAGVKGWGDNALNRLIGTLGLTQRVFLPGFVPDGVLPSLYSACQAFVYPSWFEGFGFPVLEAMACGAPVICSNTSSIPEIAGDVGLLTPPGDIDGLAALLRSTKVYADSHHTIRELGIKQAAKFTWRQTALETIQIYQRAASDDPG